MKRSATQRLIKQVVIKLPKPQWPPANPAYEYSPPRAGRMWIDPLDKSKGTIDVVELDGGKCTELMLFHKVKTR